MIKVAAFYLLLLVAFVVPPLWLIVLPWGIFEIRVWFIRRAFRRQIQAQVTQQVRDDYVVKYFR